MGSRKRFPLVKTLIAICVLAIILWASSVIRRDTNKTLISAYESSAIYNIYNLHEAQAKYLAHHGSYAPSLVELGPPTNSGEGPGAAGLIPKSLAEGKKNGYLFRLGTGPGGYAISAVPERFGNSGRRTFYSDHSDQYTVIRNNWSAEQADASSKEIK